LLSGRSLSDVNTAQSIFGVGLQIGNAKYEFEVCATITTGSTTHNTSFSLGGTATISSSNNIFSSLSSQGNPAAAVAAQGTSSSLTLFTATSTATSTVLNIRGFFMITSAGTVVPQITFSAATGSTPVVQSNSWMRMRRVVQSASAGQISIGNWA
jgi:hypothetical protein